VPGWPVRGCGGGGVMTRRRIDGAERQAHGYADVGWAVVPLVPGEKVPVTANGVHDATTDHSQIESWWGRNPDRNVGIATGAPGPDVLDVDNHGERGSGFGAYNELRRAGLVDGHRAVVATPSGGFHAYFAGSDQHNGSMPKRHLDFRGAGGYVVAPPSVTGRGLYEVRAVTADRAGVDWGAIREHLEPRAEKPAFIPRDGQAQDLEHLVEFVAGQPEGNRNAGLFWAGMRSAEAGRLDMLPALGDAAVRAGLPEREAQRTLRSIADRSGQREAAS